MSTFLCEVVLGDNRMSYVTQAHKSVHTKHFTIIHNDLIQKSKLSSSATFLLIYLISFDESWVFYDTAIMERMGCKTDKLKSLFSELRKAGYVKTVSIPGPKGTFLGRKRIFASEPIFFLENQEKASNSNTLAPSPKVGFSPCSVKPDTRVKPTLINKNKYSINKKKNLNNNNNRDSVVVSDMSYIEGGSQMDELIAIGLSRKVTIEIIKAHSITRIAEAILDSTHPKVRDRSAHIVSFLTEGWSLRSTKKPEMTEDEIEAQRKATREQDIANEKANIERMNKQRADRAARMASGQLVFPAWLKKGKRGSSC